MIASEYNEKVNMQNCTAPINHRFIEHDEREIDEIGMQWGEWTTNAYVTQDATIVLVGDNTIDINRYTIKNNLLLAY